MAIEAPRSACAASGARADAAISTELLVPFFRTARRPLAPWTQSVLDRLARVRVDCAASWYHTCTEVTNCFNEASLIESHFGRPDHALRLCHREIEWASRQIVETRHLAAAQFVFQAHINIGRLDRNNRRWDDALEKFGDLDAFVRGGSIQIGPLLVTREHARAIDEVTPGFAGQMTANYLIDSLITLLRAERFVAAQEIVDRAGDAHPSWMNDLLYEAGTIALSQAGDAAAALQRTNAYLQRPQRAHSAVFMYRRAELLHAAGDRDGAARIASGLAVAHLMSSVSVDQLNMRLMARLATLLASLGNARMAVSLARVGLSKAEQLNDVIFQREFLSVLTTHADTADQRSAANTRAEAIRRCSGYGAARTASASTIGDAVPLHIDRMYERMMSFEEVP